MMKIRYTVLALCAAMIAATGIAREDRHMEFDVSRIADQHYWASTRRRDMLHMSLMRTELH